jgi:multidrug resistance efflux pump
MVDDGSPVEAGDKVVELDTTQIVGDVAQKRIAADTALSELYQKQAEVAVQVADKEFAVAEARTAAEKAKRKAQVPAELQDRRAHQEAQLSADRTRVFHENAVADLEAYRATSQREIGAAHQPGQDAARHQRAAQALAAMEAAPRGASSWWASIPGGRKIRTGDSVVGMQIAEVPDLSSMRVHAWLSDVDDGEIAVGMPATCTIDAYPDRRVAGRVGEIGVVAQEARGNNATRRYFDVRIELEEADPEIMRPGMSVKVEVETARHEDVVLVPRTACGWMSRGACANRRRSEAAVEPGPCSLGLRGSRRARRGRRWDDREDRRRRGARARGGGLGGRLAPLPSPTRTRSPGFKSRPQTESTSKAAAVARLELPRPAADTRDVGLQDLVGPRGEEVRLGRSSADITDPSAGCASVTEARRLRRRSSR